MALFTKKETLPDDDVEEGRKIIKDLKDLKPENKKKRKEPPKPWGNKERIVVLIVLIATTVISSILLFSNSHVFEHKKIRLNIPNVNLKSINIFRGETIVIDKK